MDSTTQTKTLEFKMYHVMITDIGSIDGLDFGNDTPLSLTAQFAYEDFDITFGTSDGLGAG